MTGASGSRKPTPPAAGWHATPAQTTTASKSCSLPSPAAAAAARLRQRLDGGVEAEAGAQALGLGLQQVGEVAAVADAVLRQVDRRSERRRRRSGPGSSWRQRAASISSCDDAQSRSSARPCRAARRRARCAAAPCSRASASYSRSSVRVSSSRRSRLKCASRCIAPRLAACTSGRQARHQRHSHGSWSSAPVPRSAPARRATAGGAAPSAASRARPTASHSPARRRRRWRSWLRRRRCRGARRR